MRTIPIAAWLALALTTSAGAADVTNLQQRAAVAYREMQRAENDAKLAEQDAQEIGERVKQVQKTLDDANKQFAEAKKRAEQAKGAAAKARQKWQDADKALGQAGKSN